MTNFLRITNALPYIYIYVIYRLPKDTQPGLLRAKDASKKLMDMGLQFTPMEQTIKDAVESLKSKGFIS